MVMVEPKIILQSIQHDQFDLLKENVSILTLKQMSVGVLSDKKDYPNHTTQEKQSDEVEGWEYPHHHLVDNFDPS